MTQLTDRAQPSIMLQNPMQDHYEAFIVGNAVEWEKAAMQAMMAKDPTQLEDFALRSAPMSHEQRMGAFFDLQIRTKSPRLVVEQDSAQGKTLVLCGAGPSLKDDAADWCKKGDQVWGCNSALTWLAKNGYPVTHGFTVDQTPQMLEEWAKGPDVEYLIATTVHPHLTEYLLAEKRRVTWFHNYVGINKPPVQIGERTMEYEDWLYTLLFPGTVRAGCGLNSVTRAIDVAMFMGFEKIYVLGADCALKVKRPAPADAVVGSEAHKAWLEQETVMHADGGNALASGATACTLSGDIDGRHWVTKPDMMVSAVFLVRMKRRYGRRLTLVGDTLPNALKNKPDSFLDRLPSLVDHNGNVIKIT
jgi:hypothetical protein